MRVLDLNSGVSFLVSLLFLTGAFSSMAQSATLEEIYHSNQKAQTQRTAEFQKQLDAWHFQIPTAPMSQQLAVTREYIGENKAKSCMTDNFQKISEMAPFLDTLGYVACGVSIVCGVPAAALALGTFLPPALKRDSVEASFEKETKSVCLEGSRSPAVAESDRIHWRYVCEKLLNQFNANAVLESNPKEKLQPVEPPPYNLSSRVLAWKLYDQEFTNVSSLLKAQADMRERRMFSCVSSLTVVQPIENDADINLGNLVSLVLQSLKEVYGEGKVPSRSCMKKDRFCLHADPQNWD